MQLKIKKLRDDAIVPHKAYPTDAGYDFHYCPSNPNEINPVLHINKQKSWVVLETGIALQIPKGYCMVLFGRSGLSSKKGYDSMGGVIDHGYSGEVRVILDVPLDFHLKPQIFDRNFNGIKRYDKVAQGLLIPVPEVELVLVDSLDESERGEKGYGSSDLK
jgi:dUTP pyrophosphatase